MKLKIAVLAVALACAGTAQANIVFDGSNYTVSGNPFDQNKYYSASLGSHPNGQDSYTETIDHNIQGLFVDTLSFSITQPLNASSFAIEGVINTAGGTILRDITGMTAGIYRASDNALVAPYSGFSVPYSGGLSRTYLDLAPTLFSADNYYLRITGNAVGLNGGQYVIHANMAVVPEPETWAMLVAGLGLIGLRLRQKVSGSKRVVIN